MIGFFHFSILFKNDRFYKNDLQPLIIFKKCIDNYVNDWYGRRHSILFTNCHVSWDTLYELRIFFSFNITKLRMILEYMHICIHSTGDNSKFLSTPDLTRVVNRFWKRSFFSFFNPFQKRSFHKNDLRPLIIFEKKIYWQLC